MIIAAFSNKNVLFITTKIIINAKIEKISRIIPNNARRVQNERTYQRSIMRYPKPPINAQCIPINLPEQQTLSDRHDIERTKPLRAYVISQITKIIASGITPPICRALA